MPNPRFTAHVVAHTTASTSDAGKPYQFAVLQLDMSVNTPLYTADDDREFVEEAAVDILADPEIQNRLNPGDFVSVTLAGVLNFGIHHGFEGDEYFMEVEPEWHYWRVLNAKESAMVLEQEGITQEELELA